MGKSLLILGAGGHGKVVREVALSIHLQGNPVYTNIDFLDDCAKEAVGKIADLSSIGRQYDEVFCGIGNNEVRKSLLRKSNDLHLVIPTLIHPTAYVSPTAFIEKGTIIEPMAMINANAHIQEGCIISIGSLIDHDACIEAYCHINAGAICKAGSSVQSGKKLEAGEVIKGY